MDHLAAFHSGSLPQPSLCPSGHRLAGQKPLFPWQALKGQNPALQHPSTHLHSLTKPPVSRAQLREQLSGLVCVLAAPQAEAIKAPSELPREFVRSRLAGQRQSMSSQHVPARVCAQQDCTKGTHRNGLPHTEPRVLLSELGQSKPRELRGKGIWKGNPSRAHFFLLGLAINFVPVLMGPYSTNWTKPA